MPCVERAVRELDGLGEHAAVGAGLEVRAAPGGVGDDLVEPDPPRGPAVVQLHDQLLGDVDEPAREVPRVGGPKRGVGQALAGPVGRDEVLEHRQALAERGLDRARDHLAAGVGDEALHARDLADLLGVPPRPGVDHHVDRVAVERRQGPLERAADLGVGRGPDLDLLLAALLVGDDPALVLGLGLLGLVLVALQDLLLLGRGDDVVDRDREARLARVAEAERLDPVEAGRDVLLAPLRGDLLDDRADRRRAAADEAVHVAERPRAAPR